MAEEKYSIQLLTQSKFFKGGQKSYFTGNGTSKSIFIYNAFGGKMLEV